MEQQSNILYCILSLTVRSYEDLVCFLLDLLYSDLQFNLLSLFLRGKSHTGQTYENYTFVEQFL